MSGPLHAQRREQDEMVCKCGLRWPVGEPHPEQSPQTRVHAMKQLELPMPVSGLPLDIRSLAIEIHKSNIAAGWWQRDAVTGRTLHRNIGELLALVHSEISEADEGFQDDLPDDKLPHRRMAEVELADTAIRALDILGFYVDDWGADSERRFVPLPTPDSWDQWCRLMHRMTTVSLEGFRKGDRGRGCTGLLSLLAVVHLTAIHFRYDLTGAIAEKRAFNAQRADHKPENRAAAGGKAF